ncbi:MAG: hypothetical protein ABIH36_03155 [bacterium]
MKRKLNRGEQVLLIVLLLLVVLLLVALVQNPLLFRTAPGSRYAGLEVQQRSPSIVYEVFKPTIDSYNELVEFFRPSNLRLVACYGSPTQLSSVVFNWLTGLCQ